MDKHFRLTVENVEVVEEKVFHEMSLALEEGGVDKLVALCLTQAMKSQASGVEDQISAFFSILWMMEKGHFYTSFSKKDQQDLFRLAEILLQKSGVRPITSKLSFLYRRFYHASSSRLSDIGNFRSGMLQFNLGYYLSRDAQFEAKPEEILTIAEHSFGMGHIESAIGAFYQVELTTDSVELRERAVLGRVAGLWLQGKSKEVKSLCEIFAKGPESDEFKKEMSWMLALAQMQSKNDATQILRDTRPKSKFFEADKVLTAALWAFACKSKLSLKKIPKVSVIRYHFSDELKTDRRLPAKLKAMSFLHSCYDKEKGLNMRLREFSDMYDRYMDDFDFETRLILLASMARWLFRSKQCQLAANVINDYRFLSLGLSSGESKDVFKLVDDIADKVSTTSDVPITSSLPTIPNSSINRVLKISGLATKFAILNMTSRHRKIDDEDSAIAYFNEITEVALTTLGSLKGPMMKLGQILSHLDMNDEAQDNLKALLDSSRTVRSKSYVEAIEKELGKPIRDLFPGWVEQPIGVGSMAQVFRATTADGKDVAVKVIHPEMKKVVEADFKLINLLMPLIGYMFPRVKTRDIVELLKETFNSEIDLREEAKTHDRLYHIFKDHPAIHVPKVHLEYSTENVLVMDFVDGVKMYKFEEVASQEEKDFLVRTLFEFFVECQFENKLIQFDPHGGNYLYKDGQVAFIDFGGVREVSDKTVQISTEVLTCITKRDVDGLYDAYVRHDILDPEVVTRGHFAENLAPFVLGERKDIETEEGLVTEMVNNDLAQFLTNYIRKGFRLGMSAEPEVVVFFISNFLWRTFMGRISPRGLGPIAVETWENYLARPKGPKAAS